MKVRGAIIAVALLAFAGVGAAALLGVLDDIAPQQAGPADPFGRDPSELAAAEAEAERLENVAAAGRVRVGPGDAPSELDGSGFGADAALRRGDAPRRPTVETGADGPGAPPSPSELEALSGPPSADAAAVEVERATPEADYRAARRSASAEIAALAPDDRLSRGDGSAADLRPEFDVVRVAKDGSAVLAGRAAPGAVVQVIVDGSPTETVQADASGEFVALIAAPNNPSRGGSRRIDLSAQNPDGAVLDSLEPVIVASPAAPEQAPVAVRPRRDGLEILQPIARDDSNVTIDAVTYGESGDLTVSGRGAPGETARLYLDNALQAEARVSPDGSWRARITRQIEPARYTLRVDQTSTRGVVTSRAETPFERAEPSDVKVADGSVIVQPGNNLWRIADYVYGDGARYTVIYGQNQEQIRNPDLIYPGQVLTLPEKP